MIMHVKASKLMHSWFVFYSRYPGHRGLMIVYCVLQLEKISHGRARIQ